MDSVQDTLAGGLPHSEILGSKPTPGSPKLIAGCHVLHRLLTPRHPPDALLILASPAAGENPPGGTMLRTDALPSGPARLRTSRAGQLHVRFFCRRGGDEADRFTLTYSRCQTANGSSRPARGRTRSPAMLDWISRQIETKMVEADGFEPTTFRLQSGCSPS